MEITSYLRILYRRKWIIVFVTLVTFVVAAIGRSQLPDKYDASAVVRVIPYSNANPSFTQLAYADRIMKTYVEIGSSSLVMDSLRSELDLADNQPLSVEIKIINDTELLRITVTDYDPELATTVANALAALLINDNSIRDVRLSLMEPAETPAPPSTFSILLVYIVGAMGGLVGGVGLAFLLENIDTRFHEEKQVEAVSSLPVLGRIPPVPFWQPRRKKLIAAEYPYNHAFQRLTANLLTQARDNPFRILMITSPEPREGKSTLAANLAYNLAQSGKRVLLVDADLRRPTLHEYFGVPNAAGLGEVLLGAKTLDEVAHSVYFPTLSLVTGGELPDQLEELLLNDELMSALREQMVRRYDFVIADSPAFLGVADSLVLSAWADALLMVVRLGRTRSAPLKATFEQLDYVRAKTIGLLINSSDNPFTATYYHKSDKRELILGLLSQKPAPVDAVEPAVTQPVAHSSHKRRKKSNVPVEPIQEEIHTSEAA